MCDYDDGIDAIELGIMLGIAEEMLEEEREKLRKDQEQKLQIKDQLKLLE